LSVWWLGPVYLLRGLWAARDSHPVLAWVGIVAVAILAVLLAPVRWLGRGEGT
jgi:hypothetical protein